jgi:predicted RNase H-like nuclease (RuvC/YqgF family)
MSTVIEIEKAILTLPSRDVEKLAHWWDNFRADKENPHETARLAAILATSGCLVGAESDDFEETVAEAGLGIEDDHAW